jgi:hypothetical protein
MGEVSVDADLQSSLRPSGWFGPHRIVEIATVKAQPAGAVAVRSDKSGTYPETERVLGDSEVDGRMLGVKPRRETCLLNRSGKQAMNMPDDGLLDSRRQRIEDRRGERAV